MMSMASAFSAMSAAVNATNSGSDRRRVGVDETDCWVESGDTGGAHFI